MSGNRDQRELANLLILAMCQIQYSIVSHPPFPFCKQYGVLPWRISNFDFTPEQRLAGRTGGTGSMNFDR